MGRFQNPMSSAPRTCAAQCGIMLGAPKRDSQDPCKDMALSIRGLPGCALMAVSEAQAMQPAFSSIQRHLLRAHPTSVPSLDMRVGGRAAPCWKARIRATLHMKSYLDRF